jgi:hypothetical protein
VVVYAASTMMLLLVVVYAASTMMLLLVQCAEVQSQNLNLSIW